MNPIRLILFDCDGTLTHSHHIIVQAMQRACDDAGAEIPSNEEVMDIIGLSLDQAVDRLLEVTGQASSLRAPIVQCFRDYYRLAEQEISLFPGVHETLAELQRRGYWMGVVTGKSLAGLERVLERFDLARYFLIWKTADCCHSKPHPAMAQACMEELGVLPEQTVVVGDADFDMQMAKAAHTHAIGVSYGVGSAKLLYQQGAEIVIDTLPELLPMLPEAATIEA